MEKIIALTLFVVIIITAQPHAKAAESTRSKTQSGPVVKIRLPERFRVLTGQQFDLRVEATNLTSLNATIKILLDGSDLTSQLPAPEITTNNDSNPSALDKAWTFRKYSISPTKRGNDSASVKSLQAIVTDGGQTSLATARIGTQEFKLDGNKNIILFIGDAMGTAYRDAGRIMAKSTNNRFREGFFDDLQEMDEMPVTGMVMTYALDRVFTAEPTFYVIMGGGKERFVSRTASNSGDTRNLAAELHMNVAYDKLGLSHLRARQE